MRIVFGDYELDTDRRQLRRHGLDAKLSLKAFELLALLLDRRPEAVSKTELLERLWSETFVSDASLHNLVAEIRAALRDDPRSPRYIRTVPRYGYAFHADARSAVAVESDRARSARATASLLALRQEWLLCEGLNLVGRDRECAVCVESETVSRHHARIVITGGAATIEDLGSKNGTSVNGQEVKQPTALAEGAEIRVGSVAMTYRVLKPLPSTRTQRMG